MRNKVVSFPLWLPFLSLPRFTNVWMPLMRNQDYSRGAQWSRSCDNPLFRCWLAVEIWAGFDQNCMCKCGSVWLLFSFCADTWIPLKRTCRMKAQRPIRPLLCPPPDLFFSESPACYFSPYTNNCIYYVSVVEEARAHVFPGFTWLQHTQVQNVRPSATC